MPVIIPPDGEGFTGLHADRERLFRVCSLRWAPLKEVVNGQ
jgi:hypothetical protein